MKHLLIDFIERWHFIPGFCVGLIALLCASVLWLLVCGPFELRRFIRVKRGLCPECAYPVGESDVCTECGGILPERAAA